jgi:hypothetical protein
VYGLVWIGKLATEMIGQYFVLDKLLELSEQGRLSASQIFQGRIEATGTVEVSTSRSSRLKSAHGLRH